MMKNIYDIIAEQRVILDVNIASYDLNYTVSQFSEYHDFVQEGFGDAAKKVIDFIKKIIEKIKELIKKVIKFFTSPSSSGKTLEEDLNKKIEEHNKKIESIKSSIQEKDDEAKKVMDEIDKATERNRQRTEELKRKKEEQEERMRKFDEETKRREEEFEARKRPKTIVNDLHDLLSSSFLVVEPERFGPLKHRTDFVERLPYNFDRLYADGLKEIRTKSRTLLFSAQAVEELFHGDENDDLMYSMREYFHDDGITTKFKVFQRADDIYNYIRFHEDYIKVFKKTEDVITKLFKEIIRMIESNEFDGTEDERDANLLCNYSHMACNTAALIINYLVQSTMRAYNICAKIARDATGDYCARKNSNFKYEYEKY